MQVSLWEEESFFAPHDFIIAGAGLAGLWTALEFKHRHPSASVLILEKNLIPTGASTRNAGFACFGSPTEMISDAAYMGESKMWELVEMRYKGIEKIRKYFSDTEIGYDNCGGYECFSNKENIAEVSEKLDWLNNGMNNITGRLQSFVWVNDNAEKMGLRGFTGMIENEMEGALHSGKLVQALLQKVISAGVHILFGKEVKGWSEANKIIVNTGDRSFICTTLILATNAFLPTLCSGECVTPGRGQIIVTEPIDGLRLRGTFHYDEGYYYFRNVGNRILLGGARNTAFDNETTHELAVSENIQLALEQFLATHILPSTPYHVSHRWSGIMAFTPDKLPVIKEVSANVFAMSACNGMGVALTPIIAEKLVEQLTNTF